MPESTAVSVYELSVPLFDAALRSVHLLGVLGHFPILVPLTERELLYRLLTSECACMKHVA
jgi:hypothetical protein